MHVQVVYVSYASSQRFFIRSKYFSVDCPPKQSWPSSSLLSSSSSWSRGSIKNGAHFVVVIIHCPISQIRESCPRGVASLSTVTRGSVRWTPELCWDAFVYKVFGVPQRSSSCIYVSRESSSSHTPPSSRGVLLCSYIGP